jgi:hypothetical protein
MKGDQVFTFSQGMLRSLDEKMVDENVGLCDAMPVDFNLPLNGLTAGPMNLNALPIEGFDNDADDQWDDFDQWGHLLLDFDAPGSNWDGD